MLLIIAISNLYKSNSCHATIFCRVYLKTPKECVLITYEIARNIRQTTYHSKLHTTAKSNFVYLLSYNDLFVIARQHAICARGVIIIRVVVVGLI